MPAQTLDRLKSCLLLFLISLALLQGNGLFAQKQNAGWKGELRGIIYDADHDSVLRSATVAIYTIKDSTLLAYRLTDTKGAYSFRDVPAGTQLRLVASYIGYADAQRNFLLSVADTVVDLGRISLKVRSHQLDSVIVAATPPPVRMNGDTLEFNSKAFKLDSNAQVQDLIRILPGVTLWMADGSITVNGKPISQVLVNGKPFFGADSKIALQNLPKNIVEKVQVYQRPSESTENDKKDSTTILDIKLKKGKESGYFGKVDGGYGTSGRYESNASVNYFTGRTQMGAAFTSNNVNKVAENINIILRNSTFKGNEASTEYRPDFTAPGLNKFTSAGLLLQHDFTDKPSFRNQNQLSGTYFFKDNQQQLDQNMQTVTTVNDSTVFNVTNQSKSRMTSYGHNAEWQYNRSLDSGTSRLTVNGSYRSDNTSTGNTQQSQTTDRDHLPLSRQNSYNSSNGLTDSYDLSIGLNKFFSAKTNWRSAYQLSYRASSSNSNSNSTSQTSYTAADPRQNTSIDRRYHPSTNKTDHTVLIQLPNLSMLFTGPARPQSLKAGVSVNFGANTTQNDNDVYDVDSTTKNLIANSALSNRQHDQRYSFQPGITLNKSWTNYRSKNPPKTFRNIFGNVSLTESFQSYRSWSIQKVQNLSRSYQNFTPSISLFYTQSTTGVIKTININYRTQMLYPGLQQMAPLVDNSNPNYIQYGNPDLREEQLQNLDLTFSSSRQSLTGGAFSWSASIRGSSSDNHISASTEIDSLGKTRYSSVNAHGYRRLYLSVELKKSFRSSDANKLQIQLTALPEFSIDHSPRYVNQRLIYYNNYNIVITPTLNLSYSDWLIINLYEREGWARSTGSSIPLTNHTSSTTASGWVSVTRSLSLASNITYTLNTSTASPRQSFTLWNASVSYRLFKDQTGEIKFSALDLLHQNTGLINRATDNSIIHGDNNVLQQYFMLGVAWHPRKFGKG